MNCQTIGGCIHRGTCVPRDQRVPSHPEFTRLVYTLRRLALKLVVCGTSMLPCAAVAQEGGDLRLLTELAVVLADSAALLDDLALSVAKVESGYLVVPNGARRILLLPAPS